MGNSFGKIFKLTSFGESHGKGIGGVIDGVPPNIPIDVEVIQNDLQRRKPGQSNIVTQRKEDDSAEFYSGIFEGKTTGTPIGFFIKNKDQKTKDYNHIKDSFRPSHADFVYEKKYGNRDYRGGGRSSARETASRVVAGSIAKQILNTVTIKAFVSQVGEIKINNDLSTINFDNIEKNIIRCPETKVAKQMEDLIKSIRKEGDTIGGVISCVIKGMPVGIGEPVFDKLHAELGKAMLSINAVKGFEYGSGFSCVEMKGSEHNDEINPDGTTSSNFSGGIQGGISNGMDIYFNVAFKPVATIMKDQKSIDKKGNTIDLKGKGRHDPCVVPRAVPIVESMAAMVILDQILINNSKKI